MQISLHQIVQLGPMNLVTYFNEGATMIIETYPAKIMFIF